MDPDQAARFGSTLFLQTFQQMTKTDNIFVIGKHLFTFLAPLNLNWKTLEMFFSLKKQPIASAILKFLTDSSL